MESFRIIKPSPQLAPYVKYYWILKSNAFTPVTERTLPIGSIQLIFHKGKQLVSLTENKLQPKAFISGQSNHFSDVISTGSIKMITVVFQPCGAKVFLRIPAHEFYNLNISTQEIGDSTFCDLEKQITDTPDSLECIHLIENFLTNRLYSSSEHNLKRITATLLEINHQIQPSISQLADTACFSNRQFHRIFTEHIGIGPKEFIRIIRMQRALHTLQTQPDIHFAQLACDCGYYDQSHLIKDFKVFSGYTPLEYLSICAPYSDYFSEPV